MTTMTMLESRTMKPKVIPWYTIFCSKELQVKFWAKVDKVGDCWNWTGSKNKFGYGQVSIKGKGLKSHRIAFFLFYRYIDPNGQMKVLHSCDNPSCVNPSHLFMGSQEDNIRDMVAKKRHRNIPKHGENNPMAVLTWDEVEQIRELYAKGDINQKSLSVNFMVSPMTIHRIVNNILWKKENK